MCCSSMYSCFFKKSHKPSKNSAVPHQQNGAYTKPAKQDPVDKAVSGFLQKGGYKADPHHVEMMTDGARNMFEKKTGRKVPGFISN